MNDDFSSIEKSLRNFYLQIPGAEGIVVRVVSLVDKKIGVKPHFLEIFREENYPTEFPYKSKASEFYKFQLFVLFFKPLPIYYFYFIKNIILQCQVEYMWILL